MKLCKRISVLFLSLLVLTACSNNSEKNEQTGNNRIELKEVPEKSRKRVNKVLSDYESLIEEKLIFKSSELQDNNEIMIVHYEDEKKEIELVFTLKIIYDIGSCTSIELYGYGYSSLEPPLKNKVEGNKLTTIYYEKYYPLFKKINFDDYFGTSDYEEIDGSGDENYRNGFVGYTTGIQTHWIR